MVGMFLISTGSHIEVSICKEAWSWSKSFQYPFYKSLFHFSRPAHRDGAMR